MHTYLIEVTADIPYPWPKTYRQEAANEGAAVSRALKAYRIDVRNRSGHSRKMTRFNLSVSRMERATAEKETGHEQIL
ncbi:MAG: hypothetical protein LBS30_00560 [Planctomycetota bacterium]|jgi:hypothetical protein|nr:hypothetical protein [Planctomycetota bacterium]